MIVCLRGTEEGRVDDPTWIIPPSPLDAPYILGPLSKARREDLQTLSFVLAVTLADGRGHPIEILRGDDPPDRVISVNGVPHAVELTELTVSDIRRDLAQARHLGRQLHDELKRDTARFAHLVSRRVALAVMLNEDGASLELKPLLSQLCDTLEKDRGCVGDGVDVSNGLPEKWPNGNGFYGKCGPVILQSYRDGIANDILVSSSCQAQVRLSQTLETLNERVRVKDHDKNDILLISCGMPDEKGYLCPSDQFMFKFLQDHADRIHLSPVHLKGVFLHLWGGVEWIELYRSGDNALAWPPSVS